MEEIHPSLYLRKIIHFDMDAFFAAIEIRDDPSLRGKAVVVGGSPKSRGVVCTASYEARQYGIRSAMPSSKALRLCPNAVFVRPNLEKYRRVSQRIRKIFAEITEIIEPLSLDEAYLDVTKSDQGRYASLLARHIQNRIWDDLHLTGSAGVAPNKMLAKIASDIRKPFGITVITPEQVTGFMKSLPLRKIPGIGPVTQKKLASYGYVACQDIWTRSIDDLQETFGQSMGPWLYWRSRGVDERAVETTRERKSISFEQTFARDLRNLDEILTILMDSIHKLVDHLKQKKIWARTWTLKVKYFDFKLATRSATKDISYGDAQDLRELFRHLLQKTDVREKKIRLLGVGCSNLVLDLSSLSQQALL